MIHLVVTVASVNLLAWKACENDYPDESPSSCSHFLSWHCSENITMVVVVASSY